MDKSKARAGYWMGRWMDTCVYIFCASASTLAYSIKDKSLLPEHLTKLSVNLLLVAEVFYILTMMVLKIALAAFVLRIIIEPWQRRVVYFNLTASTAIGSGYFFYAVFQCGVPHDKTFWIQRLSGECAGTGSILGLGYTNALINALTDLSFVALAIPMLHKVRINFREKIIVGGIFVLASVLPYVKELVVTDLSFFKKLHWLVIWSAVEPGLGITAASLATLRPLLRRLESQLSYYTCYSQSQLGSHSTQSEESLASKPEQRNYSQSQEKSQSRLRNKSGEFLKEKMAIGPVTATRKTQSSAMESIDKENAFHFHDQVQVARPRQLYQQEEKGSPSRPSQQREQVCQCHRQNSQPQEQDLTPMQARSHREYNRYPYPTPPPGHILVSGETTKERRIVIRNNPFRFGRWKHSAQSSPEGSVSPDSTHKTIDKQQAIGEEEARTVREQDKEMAQGGRESPWKKARNWLPLALFGSQSSLDGFESESDGESRVDSDRGA
ncbi:hypothetical protein E2P81_ATG02672 [Venturia nashicola]|nr:hypothetical protein E2P81_ATG02672 [Venturia nashicola]